MRLAPAPRTNAGYEVTLVGAGVDGPVTEVIAGADAYAQEGPLTTFFDTDGRDVIDSWAVRLMSVRTADIAMIRRLGEARLVADAHLSIDVTPLAS